jgi:hypothetical protein
MNSPYFFVCILFKDAFRYLDHIASNNRMKVNNELKSVVGSDCSLICGTSSI